MAIIMEEPTRRKMSVYLRSVNISSRTMNPSLLRSQTAKVYAVFSSRVPLRKTEVPISHSSFFTRPSDPASKTLKIRSMRMSSVLTSKVLWSRSRNTTRSIPSFFYTKTVAIMFLISGNYLVCYYCTFIKIIKD